MSDLREPLQDADHSRNEAEELERRARQRRAEIPAIGHARGEHEGIADELKYGRGVATDSKD